MPSHPTPLLALHTQSLGPASRVPPTRSPVRRLAIGVKLAFAQQEALVLHRVRGRRRRCGGRAALGRGGARAPAAPTLAPISGPRPPARLGPVPCPWPVGPRCPLRWLQAIGQATRGKLAWLRQRRLYERRAKGNAAHEGDLGAPPWAWGPLCLLSWRSV